MKKLENQKTKAGLRLAEAHTLETVHRAPEWPKSVESHGAPWRSGISACFLGLFGKEPTVIGEHAFQPRPWPFGSGPHRRGDALSCDCRRRCAVLQVARSREPCVSATPRPIGPAVARRNCSQLMAYHNLGGERQHSQPPPSLPHPRRGSSGASREVAVPLPSALRHHPHLHCPAMSLPHIPHALEMDTYPTLRLPPRAGDSCDDARGRCEDARGRCLRVRAGFSRSHFPLSKLC